MYGAALYPLSAQIDSNRDMLEYTLDTVPILPYSHTTLLIREVHNNKNFRFGWVATCISLICLEDSSSCAGWRIRMLSPAEKVPSSNPRT